MKYLPAVLAIVMFCSSCNNKKSSNPIPSSLPMAPVSAEAIRNWVQSNTYTTDKVATISGFAMDSTNPYTWFSDTAGVSNFEKKFIAERKAFTLAFTNDSVVSIHDEGKTWTSAYRIDSSRHDEEQAGWKLRLSYPDSSLDFPGGSGISIITATYPILGIDQQQLLLATPRSYNQRKIAVLMTRN